MRLSSVLLLCAGLIFSVSCKKDKVPGAPETPAPTCVDTISYLQQVKPFIDLNCATSGCHNATGAGGYNLLTHTSVSNNANIILSAIRHDGGFTAMPLGGGQLPDSTIQQFDCWINQGKLDN